MYSYRKQKNCPPTVNDQYIYIPIPKKGDAKDYGNDQTYIRQ